jgi:hypothetical protein
VLATPHLDRHATYVALSRHRHSAAMFYGRDDFRGGPGREREAAENLKSVLSRARPKELAHDYLERERRVAIVASSSVARRSIERTENLEALSARAGYAALTFWRAKQEEREAAYGSVPALHTAIEKRGTGSERTSGSVYDPEETRRRARERWRKYREQQVGTERGPGPEHGAGAERMRDTPREHTPDDDFSL